jgi:hypothetical protein
MIMLCVVAIIDRRRKEEEKKEFSMIRANNQNCMESWVSIDLMILSTPDSNITSI